MNTLVKRIFKSFGLRIQRDRPGNRFQAMDDALLLLRAFGYAPGVVIDGGANVGQFFEPIRPIFPAATFHLIEPQPECVAPLRALQAQYGDRVHLHPLVITEPGVGSVTMMGSGTGKHVSGPGEGVEQAPGEIRCPATTLDALFADRVRPADRALLKLGSRRARARGAERIHAVAGVGRSRAD